MLFDPQIRIFWEGSHGRGWCEPWRLIYDCELVYVSEGMCLLNLAGDKMELPAGWMAIIPPALPHETTVPKRARRHCIHFDWVRDNAGLNSPLQVNSHQQYKVQLEHRVPQPIRKLLPLCLCADEIANEMLEALLCRLRADSTEANYFLWPLLRRIVDISGSHDSVSANTAANVVLQVKDFIESEYNHSLGYEDFCRISRLSKCHLCSIFSKSLGMAPVAYLNHVRLTHAARMLKTGSMNIAETARECGINDANYFTRIFRKRYGKTPERFRKDSKIQAAY